MWPRDPPDWLELQQLASVWRRRNPAGCNAVSDPSGVGQRLLYTSPAGQTPNPDRWMSASTTGACWAVICYLTGQFRNLCGMQYVSSVQNGYVSVNRLCGFTLVGHLRIKFTFCILYMKTSYKYFFVNSSGWAILNLNTISLILSVKSPDLLDESS